MDAPNGTKRGQLPDRVADIAESPMSLRRLEPVPPRGDLAVVPVADHLLLNAGGVDGAVVQA